MPIESRSVSADERAELEALIGTGEHLARAAFEDVDEVVRLIVEIEPQELWRQSSAPISQRQRPAPRPEVLVAGGPPRVLQRGPDSIGSRSEGGVREGRGSPSWWVRTKTGLCQGEFWPTGPAMDS